MQTQKKLKARVLSFILSAAMVATTMSTIVFAADEGNVDSGALDSGIMVTVTDDNGNPGPVELPNPVNFKLTDEDGSALDLSKYTIKWFHEPNPDDSTELAETGDTLRLPYTTLFMANPSIIVRVYDKQSEELLDELQIIDPYCIPDEGRRPYAIVNGKTILAGEEVDGISLSADAQTLTMDNVNIRNYKTTAWKTPAVLVDVPEKQNLNLVLKGESYVEAMDAATITLILDRDRAFETRNLEVSGDKLTAVSHRSDVFTFTDARTVEEGYFCNMTVRGAELDLKASADQLGETAGIALEVDKGTLRLEDSILTAASDYNNTIHTATLSMGDDESGMVFINSKVNVSNNCTARIDEELTGLIENAAIFVGGDLGLHMDNSVLDIQLKAQVAQQVGGIFVPSAKQPSKISNGSKVSVVLTDDAYLNAPTNSLTFGMASTGITIENSSFTTRLRNHAEQASLWGMAYGKGIFTAQNATIDMDLNGSSSNGIRYYYSYDGQSVLGKPVELTDEGTLNLTNSNININCVSTATTLPHLRPSGISGRFLNVSYSDAFRALDIKTTAALNNSEAINIGKIVRLEPIPYTPNYVSERIFMAPGTKVLSPDGAEINMFSNTDNPEENEKKYLCSETFYGVDKTQPAANVKIGYGSGGGGGGGGGSSSGGGSVSVMPPKNNTINSTEGNKSVTNVVSKAVKDAIAAGTGGAITARATFKNFDYLALDGLKSINDIVAKESAGKAVNFKVNLDAGPKSQIISRITVDPLALAKELNAKKMTAKLPLGVYFDQKSAKVSAINHLVNKYYTNKIVSVVYDQRSPLGVNAEFCAKLNLANTFGQDKQLYFYNYDNTKNVYNRIANPNYWVDKNGYAHITAPFGGSIIISDKPLAKK